jgi:LacI family transcriptional regulator
MQKYEMYKNLICKNIFVWYIGKFNSKGNIGQINEEIDILGVTMTEIAREAGVSLPTVSRFLRGDKTLRISQKTHDQILAVKERLGGVEKRVERRMMTYNIIAPVSRIFSAEWLEKNLMKSPFLSNLEEYLTDNKFLLNFNFFENDAIVPFFERLIKSSLYCDGLLLLTGIVNDAISKLLKEYPIPHVSMDPGAERFDVNTVCQNELDGIRQVVRHLRQLGHRQIGYFGPKAFRYPLFLNVMAEEGLEGEIYVQFLPEVDTFKGQESWKPVAYETFSRYLLKPNKEVTAFVCHNDWTSLGAVEAMQERGLVPGRDISLVGYDDIESEQPERFTSPILTTISTPWEAIGKRCGELLLNQIIHKQNQVVHERLPVSLVVRGSTGPCSKR